MDDRSERFREVLEFAALHPMAIVEGGRIQVRNVESDKQFWSNQAFWREVFLLLCRNEGVEYVLDSCAFSHRLPATPVPFTRSERFMQFLGLGVEQRKIQGRTMKVEAKRPSLAPMNDQAIRDGLLFFGFDEAEYKKLQHVPGLQIGAFLWPATHPYQLRIRSGQLRRLVLY